MPRIQTFVTNEILAEINALVEESRQEGANKNDVNISSVTSSLIELGLRVKKIQRDNAGGGFSQMEFNKVLLEMVTKSNALNSHILRGMVSLPELMKKDDFIYENIIEMVRGYSEQQLMKFFPQEEDDQRN